MPRYPDLDSILEEARMALGARCPDATAILCRKAAELFVNAKGPKKQDWDVQLQALYDKDVIGKRAFGVADVIRRLGNSAAHRPRGVSLADAQKSWEFTKAFLSSAGVELDPQLVPMDFDQLRRSFGGLSLKIPWVEPFPIQRGFLFKMWHGGGLIDLTFRCEVCGTPQVVEDFLVPEPFMLADTSSESYRENAEIYQCDGCEASYEITAYNSLHGWDVDIRLWMKARRKARRHGQSPITAAPKKGFFRFRITKDYEEEGAESDLPDQTPS